MRIISMTSQKGGSGKSTLAACVAAAAAQDGEKVLAIDLDGQGTLAKWRKRRGASDSVEVLQAQAADLERILKRAPTLDFTLVVLDTPGFHGPDMGLALRSVELAVVPVQPTINDVEAVAETADALKGMDKSFAFVLNRVKPGSSHGRILDVAQQLIKIGGWLVPGAMCDRNDYTDAFVLGQGASEFNPAGKAAQEVQILWAWIKKTLKDDINEAKAA